MNFSFVINVTVNRSQGKFATRAEIEEQIVEALEQANPGDLTGDEGGEYTVDDWSVEDNNPTKPLRRGG